MPDGVCPKCGWKAPQGLLKCPFCKTYIRKPGSSTSSDLKVAVDPAPKESSGTLPALDPGLPPPDPAVVKAVQREIARELFDDSDYWQSLEKNKKKEAAGGPEGAPKTAE